jgi:hypothetical protein
MAIKFELDAQWKHFAGAAPWLFRTLFSTIKGLLRVRKNHLYDFNIIYMFDV